jgi:hypothetical protein
MICSSIFSVPIVDICFRFDAPRERAMITLSIARGSMRTWAPGSRRQGLRRVAQKQLIAILMVVLAATGACTADDPRDVALATQ